MVFDTERRYYVYEWFVIDTGEVFYVGKGTKNRYRTRKRENKFFMNMLNSHECDSRIVKDGLTEEEAFNLEKKTIAYYRTTDYRLTNVCDGGENPPKHTGTISEKKRKNMCRAQQKYYAEHPEARKRNSENLKKFLKTDAGKEFRRKSNEAKKTEEFRQSQRERSIKALNTPEFHKKHSERMKIVNNRPEMKARHQGSRNINARTVQQYDMDGNFIKEYETATMASKETGVGISKICCVARGERKSAGSFKWVYPNQKKRDLNIRLNVNI